MIFVSLFFKLKIHSGTNAVFFEKNMYGFWIVPVNNTFTMLSRTCSQRKQKQKQCIWRSTKNGRHFQRQSSYCARKFLHQFISKS